jgi:uncharacterized protein YndB with AHSA1/START domain
MAREVSFELSVDIDAAPETVWAVMMEVERWHEWTPSIRSVQRIQVGELGPGKSVRIRQPGLMPAIWLVTELVPGERFAWCTTNLGLRSTGIHCVDRVGAGASRVTLAVRHSGGLVWLLRGWLSRISKRYVTVEAQGLKKRCEGR